MSYYTDSCITNHTAMNKPKGMTVQQEMQWNRAAAERKQADRQQEQQARRERREYIGTPEPTEQELYPVRPH